MSRLFVNLFCNISKVPRRFLVTRLSTNERQNEVSIVQKKLILHDGERKLQYPLVWLRDNCQCSSCFHGSSRSRTIDWENFNTNPKIRHVEVRIISDPGSYQQSFIHSTTKTVLARLVSLGKTITSACSMNVGYWIETLRQKIVRSTWTKCIVPRRFTGPRMSSVKFCPPSSTVKLWKRKKCCMTGSRRWPSME